MSNHPSVSPNAAAQDYRLYPWHVRRLNVPVPFSQLIDFQVALEHSDSILACIMSQLNEKGALRPIERIEPDPRVTYVHRQQDRSIVMVGFRVNALRAWHDAVAAALLPFVDDKVAMHDYGDQVTSD